MLRNSSNIIRKSLALGVTSVMTLAASAQIATPDAAWCDAIEQAFAGQGIDAKVRCDFLNHQRVLHITADGSTRNYTIPASTLLPDFSSPVCIALDELEFRSPYRNEWRSGYHGDRRGDYVGDSRAWMGSRSSTYHPDEVFTLPADIDFLETSLRNALGSLDRVTLVDSRYANGTSVADAPLYYLRGTVLALQRAESFVKEESKPAPPADPANHQQGDRNHQGKPAGAAKANSRKVERRYAYGKVHFELIEASTGVVVWNADMHKEDYTSGNYSNPMEDVVKSICRQFVSSLQQLYPSVAPREAVLGDVLQVVDEKKNKVESLYIGLGTNQRLRKGDVIPVYTVTEVAGRENRVAIGSVTVSDVRGPELSFCKVKKGEKDIYTAIHSGARLIVAGELD